MIKKCIGHQPLECMQTQKQEKECFFLDDASFGASINEVSSYIATQRNLRRWDGFRSGRPYASMNMHDNLSAG